MMKDSENSAGSWRNGAQSLGRALSLLKLVSAFNDTGARLSEIVEASGLSKPTAHRLLSELIASGMLMRDERKLYRLGHFSYELGIIASAQYKVRELCHEPLAELAYATGETVYLKVRSGKDVFCLDVESRDGRRWSARGSRVSLGVGACGLAILSFLPEKERTQVLHGTVAAPGIPIPLDRGKLVRGIEQTREKGYAFTEGDVVPGVSAAAVSILDPVGMPVVAVSVAMPSGRWTHGTQHETVGKLVNAAAKMRRSLVNAQLLMRPELLH